MLLPPTRHRAIHLSEGKHAIYILTFLDGGGADVGINSGSVHRELVRYVMLNLWIRSSGIPFSEKPRHLGRWLTKSFLLVDLSLQKGKLLPITRASLRWPVFANR